MNVKELHDRLTELAKVMPDAPVNALFRNDGIENIRRVSVIWNTDSGEPLVMLYPFD